MRRFVLVLTATVLTCCGRYNDGTYDRLSWGQAPPLLLAGVPSTITVTRRAPSEPAGPMTAVSLSCLPADACEARPLPSVAGLARFEVTPASTAQGPIRLEPIVSRDGDGTLWADELPVSVEAAGEVLVRRREAFTAVTEVSVEVGQTVELCLQISSSSGRFIDPESVGASIEVRQTDRRLAQVRSSQGCHTFRGDAHGQVDVVFSAAAQTRTVHVQVLSPDRVRSFSVTEVVQQGGAWIDVGQAPSPLLAMRGSLYRYYRIDGVTDDGLRMAFPARCLTIDNGNVDGPGGTFAPDIFSLWLVLDTATLRWSSQCRPLGAPLALEVRR
ncbi:MAG: hypothetical protein SFW67_01530 [Myxococcaceae bacterium]|nr:hypothetical protein [Myxococcaceae bacterium]